MTGEVIDELVKTGVRGWLSHPFEKMIFTSFLKHGIFTTLKPCLPARYQGHTNLLPFSYLFTFKFDKILLERVFSDNVRM